MNNNAKLYQNGNRIKTVRFVKETGTRNVIFINRITSERAMQMQKGVHLWFVDYIKAFDNVRHNDHFEQ